MDERLEKALAFSNYRATVENRRKALRRRFEGMTVVHKNNGMFTANPTTIAFVGQLVSAGFKDGVLIDDKNNPIQIDDLSEFFETLTTTYFTATNEFFFESTKLNKARDVKKVMDW